MQQGCHGALARVGLVRVQVRGEGQRRIGQVFVGTRTCVNIPRRGVVGWSRASRNLMVPDHRGGMSGRDSKRVDTRCSNLDRIWVGGTSGCGPLSAAPQEDRQERKGVSRLAAVSPSIECEPRRLQDWFSVAFLATPAEGRGGG